MNSMSAFALGLIGTLTVVSTALAQPAGDPVLGKQIALQGGNGVQACATCHGQHGAGQDQSGFPRLAGLNPNYLFKQIQDFKDGRRRPNTVMQAIAKSLSDQTARDAIAYYASQELTLTPRPQTPDQHNDKLGEQIVMHGNWDKNIPACIACHGPQAVGVGVNFPRLAGQQPSYIINQIKDWKNGSRKNDPQNLMRVIAERLSPEETKAAAYYLSSIQPGTMQSAQTSSAPGTSTNQSAGK